MKHTKTKEAAVLADIRDENLRYIDIAIRQQCGLNYVCDVATKYGLNRPRGARSKWIKVLRVPASQSTEANNAS